MKIKRQINKNNSQNNNYRPYAFFNYSSSIKWRRPIKKIEAFIIDIKHFFQRGKYGWADSDWFNFDGWFIYVIPQMLNELKNNHYGYPVYINTDIGKKYVTDPVEWENYLDEIITHLQFANENLEFPETTNEYEPDWLNPNPFNGNKELERKYYEREKEIYEFRDKEMKTALKMIADNFWTLWD